MPLETIALHDGTVSFEPNREYLLVGNFRKLELVYREIGPFIKLLGTADKGSAELTLANHISVLEQMRHSVRSALTSGNLNGATSEAWGELHTVQKTLGVLYQARDALHGTAIIVPDKIEEPAYAQV